MRIYVVAYRPVPESLTAAVLDRVIATLSARGHDVRVYEPVFSGWTRAVAGLWAIPSEELINRNVMSAETRIILFFTLEGSPGITCDEPGGRTKEYHPFEGKATQLVAHLSVKILKQLHFLCVRN